MRQPPDTNDRRPRAESGDHDDGDDVSTRVTGQPGYGLHIFPQHAALLAASAISPKVSRERGSVSADLKTRLERAGFARSQRVVPSLLIPIYGTDGELRLHQNRPDNPRLDNGKPRKYETPWRKPICLDVPRRVIGQLADPAVPLWITEGARKADAAVRPGCAPSRSSGSTAGSPRAITDRPADVWEPLIAVADAAGGDWPKRARAACTELAGAAETGEASLGVRLLADLAEVFAVRDEHGNPTGETETELPTTVILDRLTALEESPWAALGRPAKSLDARGLAARLRAYGIKSDNLPRDDGGARLKGYSAASLADAWMRYVPGARIAAPSAPPEKPQVTDLFAGADTGGGADTSAPPIPSAPPDDALTCTGADGADGADLPEPEPALPADGQDDDVAAAIKVIAAALPVAGTWTEWPEGTHRRGRTVTAPDPLPAATRVRKARKSSRVACGHYVLVGQVIVRRGGRWACLPCALAAIRVRPEPLGGSTKENNRMTDGADGIAVASSCTGCAGEIGTPPEYAPGRHMALIHDHHVP
jgi:Protein of unknown function (DUF3631)